MIFNLGGFDNSAWHLPDFTYTGAYTLIDDGKNGADQNWRIKFLSSGRITFNSVPEYIDVFCVGGGGGGASASSCYAGGGGGYTTTEQKIPVLAGEAYEIIVGAGGATDADGGQSSAFGVTAEGGKHGGIMGGSGGSGGGGGANDGSASAGGSDGSDGVESSHAWKYNPDYDGIGQHTTTREFGESSGDLYSGGGSGGQENVAGYSAIPGGAGGGGRGGFGSSSAKAGDTNTGGGGGGMAHAGASGGSGIVVIRNAR